MAEKRFKTELRFFGSRIEKFRKQKKMTQLDLEVACGISRTEISKIENGLKNIEFITIIKLADALEVETYKLFTDEA